jgi:hypothetical protein
VPGVYSTRFLGGPTGAPLHYRVPAGKRAVIKGINGTNTDTLAHSASLQVAGWYAWIASVPGASVINAGVLHIVVNEGEEMIGAGHASLHLAVSGFLLDL